MVKEERPVMENLKVITIDSEAKVPFNNNVDFCVGTGRMGLALRKEYIDQLRLVQKEIGFKHIRGHGLFCDDMAIYQEYENAQGETVVEYNFTYLDMVMDDYRALGLRPFLELGFMPDKMASGSQTVFYWKGNVTPPKDYAAWEALVQALLRHLIERYGADEVTQWPIEVWNEPNLSGFWKDASQPEYFKLFKTSFDAIKAVDRRFRVGGPAVCGGSDEIWIRAFLEFCRDADIPLDFVTRHHYTAGIKEHVGHYGYPDLEAPERGRDNLATTRKIINDFERYRGMEIHVTEFNTSYIPNCPLHDTNKNAAYIAEQLSWLGDENASYSYWTFGDVFEEQGVPFSLFHGGFGLVANGLVPKPTFWTFAFFNQLRGRCVFRSNQAIVIKCKDGSYRGVTWNSCVAGEGASSATRYEFPVADNAEQCLIIKRVDEECCNPLKIWHDLGEPAQPSLEELKLIQAGASPRIETRRIAPAGGKALITISLNKDAVAYFELRAAKAHADRGYSYERVMQS
jgi:xylan 1,4-beta-xylosidase